MPLDGSKCLVKALQGAEVFTKGGDPSKSGEKSCLIPQGTD